MTQSVNQFALGNETGRLTLGVNTNVFPAKVYPSSTAVIVPGMAVRLIDSADSEILIDAAAATDKIFGFVTYSSKQLPFGATSNNIVEVASATCSMYMETNAAIARGALLEYVAPASGNGPRVVTSAGTNKIVGIALDKATAAGALIRVNILSPLVAQF